MIKSIRMSESIRQTQKKTNPPRKFICPKCDWTSDIQQDCEECGFKAPLFKISITSK